MNCEEFELILPDLLEGELGGEGNSKVLSHIKSCKECNNMLQELINIRKEFSVAFNVSNVDFNSRKKWIINSIDKDKYNSKKINIRKRRVIMATLAATIVGTILITSYIREGFEDKTQSESINVIGSTKESKPLERSTMSIKDNIYSEMRKAVDNKVSTVGDIVINNKDTIYKGLKDSEQPITSLTDKDDFFVFKTSDYVFGYDKKNKNFYGFCDMNKISNSGKYKLVFATSDGRYIIFSDFYKDEESKESGSYIVDLITDEINFFENVDISKGNVILGENSDSIIILDDKGALEFEDMKKSKEYKEYSEENLKELLNKDVYIDEWKGFLTKLSKQVYGDKIISGDEVMNYINQRLYVKREGKLIEITKNSSVTIEDICDVDTFNEYNLIRHRDKNINISNLITKSKYNYDNVTNYKVSYNGNFIVDLQGDKGWVVARFPKEKSKNPLQIIEKKNLTTKSSLSIDRRNRVTAVCGIDKDKVFDIKTISVK